MKTKLINGLLAGPRGWSVCLGLALVALPGATSLCAQPGAPVVLFTGWHMNKLLVTVVNQTVAPGCPASGTFEDWLFGPGSSDFNQTGRDKLLTLVYNPQTNLPMAQRFSEQPGVTVTLKEYGKTESAPYYEVFYRSLEAGGYTRNKNIRVAGYDARLTPDMGGFLERTVNLIEQTYADNGNTPVHLVGHSNGPLYAQYLLTHTSQAWKNKFIHGFTPIAGNWPGQGWLYTLIFTGFNINEAAYPASTANATSSGLMFHSHPSTYMSASDPAVFSNQEVVIQTGSVRYTPQDYPKLFRDAGLALAEQAASYYIGFVKFEQPQFFPYVDVYAEKGSGIDTVVGIVLPSLMVGQILDASTPFLTRPGDGNQEDITNDSVKAWSQMKFFRFALTDNPGVGHMDLPANSGLLGRLLANLRRPRSEPPKLEIKRPGEVQIFCGQPMQTSLEVSSNLVDWVGFTSLNITTNTGWTALQDTNASGLGPKFYRAVLR